MKFEGFDKSDLQQFSKVQNLAYECVEAVQAQLKPGMTEKDAVRLLPDQRQQVNVLSVDVAWEKPDELDALLARVLKAPRAG